MSNNQGLPQDSLKTNPKDLAAKLQSAFFSFYEHRKNVIDRQKKDLVALRKRANATALLPGHNLDILKELYNE